MNQRHPHADVIIAWANGETIQWRREGTEEWVTWGLALSPPMSWQGFQYRIKPKTKVIKFRNYLAGGHGVYSQSEEDYQRDPCDKWATFTRWLGDWQEVEVPAE